MITRRKLLLGGLLLTGSLVSGNSKKIGEARSIAKNTAGEKTAASRKNFKKATSGDTFEAAVVGGGFAGLQAALTLGRACRKVILFDSASPRNHSDRPFHNFLGQDGSSQADFLQSAKEQLKQYDVTVCGDKVESAQGSHPTFTIKSESGLEITSNKILVATGVRDQLPAIKGISEYWGKGVYYCPFCSGWELKDRPLAVLGSGDPGAVAAVTLTGWSKDVVLLTNGEAGISAGQRAMIKELDIKVIEDPIEALEGKDDLETIVLADKKRLAKAALFIQPRESHDSPLLKGLGVRLNNWGVAELDPRGETSVRGVYVAGDASGKPFQAMGAAADGAQVAFAMSRALIFDPLQKR